MARGRVKKSKITNRRPRVGAEKGKRLLCWRIILMPSGIYGRIVYCALLGRWRIGRGNLVDATEVVLLSKHTHINIVIPIVLVAPEKVRIRDTCPQKYPFLFISGDEASFRPKL